MKTEIKNTKSFTYILPMLAPSFNYFENLECAFIGDSSKPELDQHIFLLFRYDGRKHFAAFEAELRKHPEYHSYYDPDHSHVMFVFRVPEVFQGEYGLFKEGKYSKFSNEYKKHILSFFQSADFDVDRVKKVLYKHESLYKEWEDILGVKIPRELDNASKPDLQSEIFDKTKL